MSPYWQQDYECPVCGEPVPPPVVTMVMTHPLAEDLARIEDRAAKEWVHQNHLAETPAAPGRYRLGLFAYIEVPNADGSPPGTEMERALTDVPDPSDEPRSRRGRLL